MSLAGRASISVFFACSPEEAKRSPGMERSGILKLADSHNNYSGNVALYFIVYGNLKVLECIKNMHSRTPLCSLRATYFMGTIN